MARIPVLGMEEVDALAKYLRFVVFLDAESQSGVYSSETLLQFSENVFLCGWS
jgi:hypothetical protein